MNGPLKNSLVAFTLGLGVFAFFGHEVFQQMFDEWRAFFAILIFAWLVAWPLCGIAILIVYFFESWRAGSLLWLKIKRAHYPMTIGRAYATPVGIAGFLLLCIVLGGIVGWLAPLSIFYSRHPHEVYN